MVWTMLKPLAQLSSPQPQGLFLLFLLLMLNWSFKQLDVSTTVLHGILKKWFIYLNLLVMFTQPFYIMFASWTKPFMALNRFLRLGLKGSPLNCFTQVSRPQVQILISSLIYYQFSPLIFFFFCSYNQLNSNFDLMDLDALHYFLGVQIESTPTGLFAHQNMYALDLLTKFQILA